MSDQTPLSPTACAAALGGVDASTMERLGTYLTVLTKWQGAINLVSVKTLQDPWRRHILDSAQLAAYMRADDTIADLGSGAGLPGLILAIMTGCKTDLVESDQRKATFLREAARLTDASVTVHAARAETVPPLGASVVTARALAPLQRLLPWVHRHLAPDGRAVILKGAGVDEELTLVHKQWSMSVVQNDSLSDASGRVLTLTKLAPINVG